MYLYHDESLCRLQKKLYLIPCVDVDDATSKSVVTMYYSFTCSVTYHAYLIYVKNCQTIKLIMKAFNINTCFNIYILFLKSIHLL